MESYRLAIYDRTLCVVWTSTAWSEPIVTERYWPVRPACALDVDMIADVTDVAPLHDGIFRITAATEHFGSPYGPSRWTSLRLVDGGRTMPIHSTERPYLPPAARGKPIRYEAGEWQRKLARGWVVAPGT